MKRTKLRGDIENNNSFLLPRSIDDLPTPILHDILVKLPFKCLQRSKCVSKSWLSHISSPAFAILHRRHSLQLSVPDQHSPYRLLIFNSHHHVYDPPAFEDNSIYSIDLDDPLEQYSPKKIPLPPSLELLRDKYVVGRCNGLLLCLGLGDREFGMRIVYLLLLNPSTGAYREIPRMQVPVPCDRASMIHDYTYGLAYDRSTDDYKVIRLGYRRISRWDIWVYSLRVGSWKWVARDDHQFPFFQMNLITDDLYKAEVLIDNHLLHWLFRSSRTCKKTRGIACFDVCNEEWNQVPLPENGIVDLGRPQLGVLDGCLCFLSALNPPQRWLYEVMVMKQYGVKESWVKLFNISHSVDIRFSLKICPIAYSRNRTEILLRKDSRSRIFWYNLREKTKKMAIIPKLETPNRNMSICTCIQTLAPFPGCSNPIMAKRPKEE